MKITFVLPQLSLSGGIRVLAIYARELSLRGHDVLVVSQPAARPRLRSTLRQSITKGSLRLPSANLGHFEGLDVPHRVLDRPRPVTDADVPDADVVVATWWVTGEWVHGLSPSKGLKVLFVQGDDAVEFADQPSLFRRADGVFRLPFQIITISERMRTVLHDTYGQPRVDVVSNGVDTVQFDAPARGKQSAPTVGYLYNPAPVKNCGLSARAIELARTAIPGLRVVAFGAEAPTSDTPLPARTEFTLKPAQDELKRLYARCDAWLLSSKNEGFGLPILEAMACRTPVIATPVGAAPEWISRGGGLLVRQDDAADMARAILELVRMPDATWRGMSARAHAAVRDHDWRTAARHFEQALHQALYRSHLA